MDNEFADATEAEGFAEFAADVLGGLPGDATPPWSIMHAVTVAEIEARQPPPRRLTPAAAQNEALQLVAKVLFALDAREILTVDDIVRMPEVRRQIEERGIAEGRARRVLNEVAPPRARKPGRRHDPDDEPRVFWIDDGEL